MVSQQLAETAELGLAGILGAELEGLVGGRLVHQLQTGVVLEDVEDSAVSLPQELEPWGDNGAVGSVAGLLTRDGGEEDRLGSLGSLKIIDVLGLGRGLEGGLDFVGLGLGLGDLLLGEFDEALEDELRLLAKNLITICHPYLNSANVGVLGRVLVLVQAVLCELAFAEIDAELDEEDHDGLEGGDGAVAGPLRGDMFVEELEGSLLLLDSDEFLGAFTSLHQFWAMRAVKEGHTAYSPAWSAVAAPCWAVGGSWIQLLESLGAWGASGRRSE
jgi:hypothetical protein